MEQLTYSIEQFRQVLSEAWDKSQTIGEGYQLPVVYHIEGKNLTLAISEPILNTKIADNEIYCFHCLMHQQNTKGDVIDKAFDEVVAHLQKGDIIPSEKKVYKY